MKLNYFNFKQLQGKLLLTNDFGNYLFLDQDEFRQVMGKKVSPDSQLGQRLLSTGMAYEESDLSYSFVNRYALREKKRHLGTATSLHIFVVTTACNLNCVYCQANNGVSTPHEFMNTSVAERAVDVALQSPAKYLSFEFQGGEPLLNYPIIKHIVEYTEKKNENHDIRFNLVSNLTLLTDDMITFFAEHKVGVSTSVDGHQLLHDRNRPFKSGAGSFEKVAQSVHRLRAAGISVGAIQTTTRESLKYPKQIVQAYHELGFDGIFIRPLTPLGKASKAWEKIGYSPSEYLSFYTACMEEIIAMNKAGIGMHEDHSAILLGRVSGRFVNYMELRSPCGAGIGQLAYFTDGNIFTCDEGRMLYEMGDDSFCLGNVFDSTYSDIIKSGNCSAVCSASILESIPGCCDCVYQPYCGTCPVVSFSQTGDIIEKTPRGYRCQIYGGMLDYLFTRLLENDDEIRRIFETWSD